MTVVEMRKRIADAYSGRPWRDKVDRMSDAQVLAVYRRIFVDSKGKK